MKVTQVAIRPTPASDAAGRPALTPELLAASGARYSRNNEGLDAILEKIDPTDLDRSVDSIFRMIDYGHQSIADMVPVALFLDGISIWLAYYVWTLCPTAGGQESSTRYIRLSADGLIAPEEIGLPGDAAAAWRERMDACFDAYRAAVRQWEKIAAVDPDIVRIPRSLLDADSEKAKRQVKRMRRNYAFDRARYFLPVAARTNAMLIMSARGWTALCGQLLSHPLLEAQRLGAAIVEELSLAAPRMLRHAVRRESTACGQAQEFARLQEIAKADTPNLRSDAPEFAHAPTASLSVGAPDGATGAEFARDLAFHENRYAWFGSFVKRTTVRFSWEAVAFAEIRDLNRHRTGTKYCPLAPVGFYAAEDELPTESARTEHRPLAQIGRRASAESRARLTAGDPLYIYETLLGTQYPFEHVTTADHFLYEAELRTGTGAHYRYARHLRDALALWYERYPETRGLVLEGSAEPE